MIQYLLSLLKEQRGGVATAVATGFMVFSIPLISGSLGLAQAVNIDARVKTESTLKDYCGLAVVEFFDYLMADSTRFQAWLVEHDPQITGIATDTLDLANVDCGVTLEANEPGVGGDPVGEDVGTVPFLGVFQQRKFQTFITVDNPEPNPGDSVLYTIQVVNRVANQATLSDIRNILPPEFRYDFNGLWSPS